MDTSMLKKTVKKIFLSLGLEIYKIPKTPIKFFEIEEDFNNIYKNAQNKTQMTDTDNLSRRERHYTLTQLIKSVSSLDGDVVECGCWKGLSSYQLATNLKENKFSNTYYIFDSFEGLSKFDKDDIPLGGLDDEETRRKEFACGEDIVKNNLKEFNFIEYKKGWIPTRFNEVVDKKFSFVHIDVDMYQPILDSLEFFYERMVSGGIIVLDDYGFTYFPGAKKAVDEFMSDKDDFFLALSSGQAFMIKN